MSFEDELVALYPKLRNYARKLASRHDKIESEDLVQDAAVALLSAKFKTPDNFSAWAHRSLHNEYVNSIRRKKYHRDDEVFVDWSAEDNQPLANDSAETLVAVQDIHTALSKLTDQRQDILTRFAIDGEATKDIAQSYNITPGTVQVMVHQSRKKIKEYLDGKD